VVVDGGEALPGPDREFLVYLRRRWGQPGFSVNALSSASMTPAPQSGIPRLQNDGRFNTILP
jgi:hypothetical protein